MDECILAHVIVIYERLKTSFFIVTMFLLNLASEFLEVDSNNAYLECGIVVQII